MKKQYLLGSFIISALLVPVSTSAATVDEIRTQIENLSQQISQLRAQMTAAALYSDRPATFDPAATQIQVTAAGARNVQGAGWLCPVISRTLARGAKGDDVVKLQQFLIDRNILATGNATGYFGPLTEKAVVAFQQSENLETVGIVGPKTRAAVQKCKPPPGFGKTSDKSIGTSPTQTTPTNGSTSDDPQLAMLNTFMNSSVHYPVISDPTKDECSRTGTRLTEKDVLKIAESNQLDKPERGWWEIMYNKSESFYQPETGSYPVVYACVWEISLNLLPPAGTVSDYGYISGHDRVYVNDATGTAFRLCRSNGAWVLCAGSTYK